MATKLTFIGAAPAATTGADVVNAGPQTPTVADQNLANLRAAVDAKAALAGSATQDFAAKTLTATTVNANNIGEITHSQGIVTTYAASGSTGIQIANNDNLNFGTGDFTLVWKGSLPDWTPLGVALINKQQDLGGGNWSGISFNIHTDGKVRLQLAAGSGVPISFYSTAPVTAVDGAVTTLYVVINRSISEAKFYENGIPLGAAVSISVVGSFSTTNSLYLAGTSATRTAATTQSAYVFNRALSADEVLSLHKSPYGVAESDKWGSQTPTYTSDFSAGVDGWSAYRGSVSGNIDAVGGLNDWLRYTVDSTLGTHNLNRSVLVIGARYRLKFIYYLPSSNVTMASMSIWDGTGVNLQVLSTKDQSALVTIDFTAISGSLYFYGLTGSSFTGNGTDVFYFKDVVVTRIGATLALEPEGIQPAPGQWLDSSTNKLHAMQPATGSSLARKKENFEIRWTNTWAGTHEAQFLGGINQAVLPPNCYIESIIGVVSGTVIEDIILGDGVDTDRWVTITTGLAAGTVTFAVASRVSDGTNKKLVVDPDANFTGSISWVIKGIIL